MHYHDGSGYLFIDNTADLLATRTVSGTESENVMEQVERLKARLAERHNLELAARVLGWDQATYMPRGGAAARAEQLATLGALAHRLLVDDATLRLLDAAEAEVAAAGLGPDDDAACLVRVVRRDYTLATRVPTALIEEQARTGALAYGAWVAAHESNDFPSFAPWLEKSFDLARQQAEYLGYSEHIYDALLDLYEPGMTAARLAPLFAELRAGLTPLLRAIARRQDAVDDAVLHRTYDDTAQLRLAEHAARCFGFDGERGRLDLTVHPFCTSFSHNDVRLTTRIVTTYLPTALLGTMHETGHGLYEQNISAALEGTPLANAASFGLHESQSRLWENVVGSSRDFWEYFFPLAQQTFPAALGDVDAEALYRALNKVNPAAVRIEADEVSYNLHIMLRFDLEKDVLAGKLAVRDLPDAWNAASREYLDVTPPNDAAGVMQDVHWSSGLIGYFPTYTIGNVLSVQFYEAARRAVPAIPDEMRHGEFAGLLGWLRENICRQGRKYLPDDLIVRATGQPMTAAPYLRYLRDKYGAIYGV